MYYRQPVAGARRGTPWAAIVLVAVLAGALGCWLFTRLFPSALIPTGADNRAPVVLRTVSVEPGEMAGEPVTYASVIEAVAAKSGPSVVEVITESKATHRFYGSYIVSGAGSGVILSEDGYIVTNDHVISDATSISVRTPDGEVYDAALVGTDPQTDLAVLKINATGLTPTVFADSDAAVVGETAVAIGNPLGTLGGSVTEGIISAKDREIIIGDESMVLLQTSAAISPGNSGGGLFDRNGNLVGVINAKSGETNVEGIGFAIPANTVASVTASLIENGFVTGRPSLGVEVADINTADMLFRYGLRKTGVYVTDSGGTELAQLDRIAGVNGVEVTNTSELRSIVERYAVNETLELQIERGGRNMTVYLTLTERGGETSGQSV